MITNNLIRKEICREYDPKTAFGNKVILNLLKKIVKPNDKGYFEIYADVEEKHIFDIGWNCIECGRYHREEINIDHFDYKFGKPLKRKCDVCGEKHEIEIDD